MNNAFDKVIGYESIKKKLLQICDILRNREDYEKLGAKIPRGLLLYGEPGMGKSLMASCLIQESGLPAYTVRRTKTTQDFLAEITTAFEEAKAHAPAIVFLDDMDKFANEDYDHRDTEEYVAVQSGIDNIRDADILVLATANDKDKLPSSLIRKGRFDRQIEVCHPGAENAEKIIRYYLKDKPLATDVNLDDIAKMICYESCAELETIINEAAIDAVAGQQQYIGTQDLVNAVLRTVYDEEDCTQEINESIKSAAWHEAGHLVVSEALSPGQVGVVSMIKSSPFEAGGFMRRIDRVYQPLWDILISLGGKTATELCFPNTITDGCDGDLRRARNELYNLISDHGYCGLGPMDSGHFRSGDLSNTLREEVLSAELFRCTTLVRSILIQNRAFLDEAALLLLEKGTLLYSDIQALRERAPFVPVKADSVAFLNVL